MQQTRLNTLVVSLTRQLSLWLVNPWRRLSVVLISLLFGHFFGIAIAAYTGQAAEQDILIAAILVVVTEVISRWIYRQPLGAGKRRSLLPEALNAWKLGITYSLFVEAFKLGS